MTPWWWRTVDRAGYRQLAALDALPELAAEAEGSGGTEDW
jgi:hypothetical protein